MAYGLRDGASPIIGLIESYRQERVIRDKMKLDERRFEEGLKQQKFENDLRIDDMQYRAERAGVEDSQWNKEYKRLTDAEAEDERRYNNKVALGSALFSTDESDVGATEPSTQAAPRAGTQTLTSVVNGESGTGTLRLEDNPDRPDAQNLVFDTPDGPKPLNNRDPRDNDSPPAMVRKSETDALSEHANNLLAFAAKKGLGTRESQAYVRSGFYQQDDGFLRIATPDEQAANLKNQALLYQEERRQAMDEGVPTYRVGKKLYVGTVPEVPNPEQYRIDPGAHRTNNTEDTTVPRFNALDVRPVTKAIGDAYRALVPDDKVWAPPSRDGAATDSTAQTASTPEQVSTTGAETGGRPAVSFKPDGTVKVGVPPKDDSAAFFGKIGAQLEQYKQSGGATPPAERVDTVATTIMSPPPKFSARYAQKLGEAVALGIITAEQAQNRLDTGSFSLSKQDLVGLASDLKVDKARYAKNIAEMEKIVLETKSKGDWANDVSSPEYKAVRGNVGTSIGYVVDGLGFKDDDKNYATGVLNTAVDAFFGSGNYAKAIFNRPDGVVVMQEALKDMAYDIKSGKPVESATPYVTTIAKKHRRESANVFRELAASGVSAEGEYKKSVIEMNGKQYEVPNSIEAITLYGEYLFNKRLAENGGAELSEAQYNEFLVDLYKTFKAE